MILDLRKNQKIINRGEIKSFPVARPINKENFQKHPENPAARELSSNVLFHWRAPEFEVYKKSRKWYLTAVLILAAIIIYALVSNSPIMAITFILIGFIGYIHLEKNPRVLDFMITIDGIAAENEIYEFDTIRSFWIFYDPPCVKIISLRTKNKIFPYIHIPIHHEDPVKIREILLKFIPEERQEPNLIDTIERMLHI